MVGYACYADRFAGTLEGVRAHIDYLRELGVTYLHLMPVLQPREGDNDGGYAVADYRAVRSDLGTVDDLRTLAAELRANGISLVADLVLNHVAREHAWAQAASAGDEHYRDYFYVFDDREMPDAYERTLPEVFPDFAPGSFTWDDDLSAWVWTTFNTWQWDVNWSNPDVFVEYAEIVLFLAGARGRGRAAGRHRVRLEGAGHHLPEPAAGARDQRRRCVRSSRIAAPAVIFKAEAIVAPQDLVHYLGQGARHGKVSDLAYHNSLMVQVWSMLAAKDVRLTVAGPAGACRPCPPRTAWITYLRCHDDIGWAIDDADAAAVGLNGYLHREFLSDWYSGQFPGSPADGLVFQHNPATGDRRISGSAAALVGLDRAVRDGDEAATQVAIDRLLLAHAIVVGFGGIPVLWMGDELGLPNDVGWAVRARPRRRQPLGAPAADALGGRRRPARLRHRPRAGLRRGPPPGRGPGRDAAPERDRAGGGARRE